MRIIVFGAGGTFGRAFTAEALVRGHAVTAFIRTPGSCPMAHPRLQVVEGDARQAAAIARAARGHEVAVSAIGPNHGAQESVGIMQAAARALVAGLAEAGVPRLAIVGGAGSLRVPSGQRLVDTPGFPEAYRPLALAHAEAYEIFTTFPGDWTYFSPAAEFFPGERQGGTRLGGESLLTDAEGRSRLSYGDGVAVLLDVLEAGTHRKARFTAAY